MGLKQALIDFTDVSGNAVSRTLTIKDVVFHYQDRSIEVIYQSVPQDAEKAALAEPEYLSHLFPIDLTNPADIQMILSASDRIWEIAENAPLVYVPELDRDGNRVTVRKTIREIGGVINAIK